MEPNEESPLLLVKDEEALKGYHGQRGQSSLRDDGSEEDHGWEDEDDEEGHPFKSEAGSLSWRVYAWATLLLGLAGLAYWRVVGGAGGDEPGALPASALPHKSRIFLFSPRFMRYVRFEKSSLLLTETLPWQHGSTLEVHRSSLQSCFQLKTMANLWLRLDSASSEVRADGFSRMDGSYFAAIGMGRGAGPEGGGQAVALKICRQPLWLEAGGQDLAIVSFKDSNSSASPGPPPPPPVSSQLTVKLSRSLSGSQLRSARSPPATSHSHRQHHDKDNREEAHHRHDKEVDKEKEKEEKRRKRGDEAKVDGGDKEEEMVDNAYQPFLFSIQPAPRIQGVNLGGWFIPEVWMNPSFFAGSGLGWSGSLCAMVNASRAVAEHRMEKHLLAWVTADDFREIARQGYNSIRLPLGYWNVLDDPYDLFVPADSSQSLRLLDWAFAMAERHNLSILLDLHGAPGSQNGQDHSGCNRPPHWSKKANQELSLRAIEIMAKRFGQRKAFLGIELLNEPSQLYSDNKHEDLVAFYQNAYEVVRKHSRHGLVVFNEMYEANYKKYAEDLQEPQFYNVVMDLHLYNWQEPHTSESVDLHIRDARSWSGLIETFSVQHPIVVGEWSMSTGTMVRAGQAFVDACTTSFQQSLGWYAWTWKVERAAHFDEWDVQYQYSKRNGLRPHLL
eukprot:gene11177-12462_t